eukprot:Nitzschia sp. Nitz4//scaffold32_size149145//15341//17021//NITZ4_002864-RA/size149145-processed-gene-0.34-mRNA-1//1//CDS//3329548024//243//frame0
MIAKLILGYTIPRFLCTHFLERPRVCHELRSVRLVALNLFNMRRNILIVLLLGVAVKDCLATGETDKEYQQDENGQQDEATLRVLGASGARWLTQESLWGSLTTLHDGELEAKVLPMATSNSTGRIFFYLMGEQEHSATTLSLSQAALTPDLFSIAGCGTLENAVDAQFPSCAKIALQGTVYPCVYKDNVDEEVSVTQVGENCEEVGQAALFEKHPTMETWPENHNFRVHELVLEHDIWFIARPGGSFYVTLDDYFSTDPQVNQFQGQPVDKPDSVPDEEKQVPNWEERAHRARWVVKHALWTTLSTVSSQDSEDIGTFANIRSVVDGHDAASSTGQPSFYLPDVDQSALDIAENADVALTFSEASLAQLVTPEGHTCGGQDAGWPTCAQVILYGTATPVEGDVKNQVLKSFEATHVLAPYLANGGSHMSGTYYQLQVNRVVILDYFGGRKEVDLNEYLTFDFSASGSVGVSKLSASSVSNGLWLLSGFMMGLLVGAYKSLDFCCFKANRNTRKYDGVEDLELSNKYQDKEMM